MNKTLNEFFLENKKTALAFSGGVDSTYLLYVAKSLGADIKPYFIKTVFQPEFELNDAKRAARELNAELTIVEMDILNNTDINKNCCSRCYYCKTALFSKLKELAASDGYNILIDGNNASDDPNDRQGMRAVKELNVLSPLSECGLTKSEIRSLSKEAGLFTWDKPAYACLATRIPEGEVITKEALTIIENAEDLLFSLGFSDFRVRMFKGFARIQIPEAQMGKLLENRVKIHNEIKGFKGIFLDLMPR